MITKIEITKTYWIGVSAAQKGDLLDGVRAAINIEKELSEDEKKITLVQFEALNDLRQALLNA